LVLQSEEGDYIGLVQTWAYGVEVLNFWAGSNYHSGVSFDVSNVSRPYEHPDRWTVDFAAPGHAPLTVNTHDAARRFPFKEDAPGLSISGEGRGCNGLTGRFVTLEIVANPQTNEITRFAADFEQHCEVTARDSSAKEGYAYTWVKWARNVNNKN
jgi:hypothetical protein